MSDKQTNEYMPLLTLSMADKIYLAVAKKVTSKMAFVYTLACSRTNNQYNPFAVPEIHAFKSESAADVYHATIDQIVGANSNDVTKEFIFKTNEQEIEKFLEYTR